MGTHPPGSGETQRPWTGNCQMKALIQHCKTEREEIRLIREYRKDEHYVPTLTVEAKSEGKKEPHPWLIKHYEEKRLRTIRLVKAAVDRLLSEKQTVTIEAICRKSTELDPEGRGVKKSSILENTVAHADYREHSTSYRISQVLKGQTRSNKT